MSCFHSKANSFGLEVLHCRWNARRLAEYEDVMFVVDTFMYPVEFVMCVKRVVEFLKRNQGIALGDNPYIAFLDGDDYWYDEHLIEFVNYMRDEPDEGVVYWTAADCILELVFPKSGERHQVHRISNHIIDYDRMTRREQLNAIKLSPLMTSQVALFEGPILNP